MKHPIEQYWAGAFHRFQVTENSYFCPEFPDPILSANFGNFANQNHFNSIGEKSLTVSVEREMVLRNQFHLVTLNSQPDLNSNYQTNPLREKKDEKKFQAIMREAFPETFLFLSKLYQFLPQLDACYEVISLGESQQQIDACAIVGTAGEQSCVLSGAVSKNRQSRGLSHQLRRAIQDYCFQKNSRGLFFWTSSPRLLSDPNQGLEAYRIYTRKKENQNENS